MESLVRRLLDESLTLSKPHSLQNYCKLPNAYFPLGFKAPKYRKYDETTDPQFHLADFTMDSHRWLYDRVLLVHLFQQSSEGEALRWFTFLPASDLLNFDIVSGFISHFSYLVKWGVKEVNQQSIQCQGGSGNIWEPPEQPQAHQGAQNGASTALLWRSWSDHCCCHSFNRHSGKQQAILLSTQQFLGTHGEEVTSQWCRRHACGAWSEEEVAIPNEGPNRSALLLELEEDPLKNSHCPLSRPDVEYRNARQLQEKVWLPFPDRVAGDCRVSESNAMASPVAFLRARLKLLRPESNPISPCCCVFLPSGNSVASVEGLGREVVACGVRPRMNHTLKRMGTTWSEVVTVTWDPRSPHACWREFSWRRVLLESQTLVAKGKMVGIVSPSESLDPWATVLVVGSLVGAGDPGVEVITVARELMEHQDIEPDESVAAEHVPVDGQPQQFEQPGVQLPQRVPLQQGAQQQQWFPPPPPPAVMEQWWRAKFQAPWHYQQFLQYPQYHPY
ncbi:hypothetical protein Taro_052933 [Colocasia esculenta]|uniref:Uncharacterized protein n=1 Tax=Colocasia esculenta TaxID=4460 RepID=A0A843XLC0_COLES|nr:hypothetical protein [Colocasia esculenta]